MGVHILRQCQALQSPLAGLTLIMHEGPTFFVLSQISYPEAASSPQPEALVLCICITPPRPPVVANGALRLLPSLNYQSLGLDGSGGSLVSQSLGFICHMLGSFLVHSRVVYCMSELNSIGSLGYSTRIIIVLSTFPFHFPCSASLRIFISPLFVVTEWLMQTSHGL